MPARMRTECRRTAKDTRMIKKLALCCMFFLSLAAQNALADGQQPVKDDSTEGLPSLRRDAENGDPDAQEFLGMLYIYGDHLPHDKKEGCRLLRESAKKKSKARRLYDKHCR